MQVAAEGDLSGFLFGKVKEIVGHFVIGADFLLSRRLVNIDNTTVLALDDGTMNAKSAVSAGVVFNLSR